MIRSLKVLFRTLVLFGAMTRLVFGYIDPNTGGMLFQLLIGLVTVGSAMILFFPRQLKTFFARVWRAVRGVVSHDQ